MASSVRRRSTSRRLKRIGPGHVRAPACARLGIGRTVRPIRRKDQYVRQDGSWRVSSRALRDGGTAGGVCDGASSSVVGFLLQWNWSSLSLAVTVGTADHALLPYGRSARDARCLGLAPGAKATAVCVYACVYCAVLCCATFRSLSAMRTGSSILTYWLCRYTRWISCVCASSPSSSLLCCLSYRASHGPSLSSSIRPW